jgi:predicted phosphodiesterase
MRIAIFSDIHGNRQALEAVLADITTQQVDAVYCLGDLVGYGAAPNEVTERIRAENDVKSAADAIRATELPSEFAADIESGGTT